MLETRAEKVAEMEMLYAKLEAEQRAITEEEEQEVAELTKEIENIDKTVDILDKMKAKMVQRAEEQQEETSTEETGIEAVEERAFADYLRGEVTEERAQNMTAGQNGSVIPTTIANKIIKKVYAICPILEKSTIYHVKGTLKIPFYPKNSETDIKMAYSDEFTALGSTAGEFGEITLTGYLAGALTLVSQSLINNSQFDIVSFVIDHMAYNISRWVEGELLNGTVSKIDGLSKVVSVKAKAAKAVTADELIELQDSVKDPFQKDAVWIMSAKTRTAIRKLKDGNNRYLLQDDITAPFGKTLLGKPVYISDNMPEMEASKRVIIYGDLSGLAVKISEEMNVQVLREKYADMHAVGVVAWLEMDAKVENEQKLAVLEMAAV